ncbi:hypothetical protein FXO38_10245 [Capsicum annuum]|nr:hypothetical protein FXO37_13346 [Capsicum annuum]KAF3664218.1 hypothetical protein FXO38_10245 [Capsicum annuum]
MYWFSKKTPFQQQSHSCAQSVLDMRLFCGHRGLDGYPKKERVERLNAGNHDLPTRNYGTLLCDLVYLDLRRPNLGLWLRELLCDLVYLDSCRPNLGLWLGALLCDLVHYYDMLI